MTFAALLGSVTSTPTTSPATSSFGMDQMNIVFATLGALASLIAIIGVPIAIIKWVSKKKSIHDDHAAPKAKGRKRDNLPSIGLVIGRQIKVKELLKRIDSYHMVLAQGVGGIGKSTLAICVAKEYERRKKAHVIWVTSKNEVLTLDKILNTIARLFDFTGIDSLALDAKSDKILQLLKQNRSLLIVDNYETIEKDEEIKAFLNAVDVNCKILITSRNNITVSPDQANLQVDNLSQKNAILLMRKELEKNGRPDLSGDDCKELFSVIGGSPLAIKWAIGQIAINGHTVATIASQLQDGISEAEESELFKNIFQMAWQELNDTQKDILFLLQFFVTPVSARALGKLSGTNDETKFINNLSKLLKLSLVECTPNDIKHRLFSMHSLTNSFVLNELKKIKNGDCEIAKRVLENYKLFCSERCALPHEGKKDYDDIEREWQNIAKAIAFVVDNISKMDDKKAIYEDVLELSKSINVFLWSRGYWQERIDLCRQARNIAKLLEKEEDAGQFACFVGIVFFWQSKNSEAAELAQEATMLLSSAPISKRVLAKRLSGLVQLGNARYDDAVVTLRSVFATISPESDEEIDHREVAVIADWVARGDEGYKTGRVSILQEIGICYNRKGEYENALLSLKHSESLARSIGDTEGLSVSLSHLGNSLLGLGRNKEAKAAYKEGLMLALSIGRKSTTARCYEGLTRIARRQRNLIFMFINGRKALELYERLNMQTELNDIKDIIAIKIFNCKGANHHESNQKG